MGVRNAVPLALIDQQQCRNEENVENNVPKFKTTITIAVNELTTTTYTTIKCNIGTKNDEESSIQSKKKCTLQPDQRYFNVHFINATTTNKIKTNSRSRIKTVQTYKKAYSVVNWLKNSSTILCYVLHFLSFVSHTPATIYATKTKLATTNEAVSVACIALTSVLLHAPYIAASSLRTTSIQYAAAKNYDSLFVLPQLHLQGNTDVEESVDVNDMEQETSNEQQLLAYYKRAQLLQQQQQQIKNHKNVAHDFDQLVMKRAATRRSIATPTTTTTTTSNIAAISGESNSSSINITATTMATKIIKDVAADAAAAITSSTSTLLLPMPSTYKTLVSLSSIVADGSTLSVQEPSTLEDKCEPKVLDEVPTEPFYDFTDIVKTAAHHYTEFLATIKFPTTGNGAISDELRDEVRRRATIIATNALDEDDNLLAFAIAAPQMHAVVVKFRENVTIPPEEQHNKAFLGSYWRVLGQAWDSGDNIQEWSAPFRDCNLLKGRWLWPYRITYTEFKIKIAAAVFIAADEDVCNDGLAEIFGRRHGCDRNTTFCLLMENKPMPQRDVYNCICRDSYYLPNSTLQGFRGDFAELSEGYDNYSCIPCPGVCSICNKDGECLFGEPEEVVSIENLFKITVGVILGACILCCFVFSIVVFRQRKSKAIAFGMWTVLETILLGIVLLYLSVAVHFFPATAERCLLEPWLRELGFITCYGAIILKIYRHLVDFRTRKAHRWVLRDVDLLKYLATMVFAVICYMAAFTASSLDLLRATHCLEETLTNTCYPLKWEFVTQASEMVILCFGLHISVTIRNANTQFRERQFLVISLAIEFFVSSSFYVLRYIYLQEMSPDAIFLALFLRSQLTNTVALLVIFVPKLWYQHKQVRSLAHDLSIRLPVDAFKGSHDVGQRLGGGYAGLCLGDPDIGELTISEMNPEDIRAELKRLYTQLEVLKNKTLRQDNPHISKRRGGRKTGHRRFSLQKKGSKDKALSSKHRSNKQQQDVEITEAEPSRTPEDSVCSAEGPTDTFAEISGISHSVLSHSK